MWSARGLAALLSCFVAINTNVCGAVSHQLESGRHLWTLAFIPLIFISLLSIAICIWALKNERGFELELFCAVNILQFIFIALRLDGFITWSWVVVFVPFWIVMCLAIIGVLYALVFAAILLRTPEVSRLICGVDRVS